MVPAFSGVVITKVNVIARLEFELVYYNIVAQYGNRYSTETPPHCTCKPTIQLERIDTSILICLFSLFPVTHE